MRSLALGLALFLVPMFILAGCTMPKSSAQAVYQLQGDYAAALSVENNYDRLPTCGGLTKPIVCKKLTVAKMVRQIDDTAWAAISEAQKAVRTPGYGEDKIVTAVATASSAVAAFTNIVQTLGVK